MGFRLKKQADNVHITAGGRTCSHTAANLVFFPGVVDPDIAGSAGPITNPELDPYSKKGGDREPEI